ncbi:hypothetical protein VW29_01265 [Devosia limi DSM 17137]|uniref:Sarcosine oxidase subunit alpha n=1 Tax=Devosia limi DSM 17137 TaxID=1121477 RepID=A0A0F5LWS6_9HYPH|nr:FAD-dependent oxidoreductase [Devosia limi]KKB86624.1 hypothetical protein VW29_01265 [Devosia limi DSM 17137]SHE38825.1 sarcosine oxidase subunit alpha [Devosia limi DSM 17137]
MNGQPNRLDTADRHLQGSAIDRSKPLRFRLDGRTINGFAGDSVLSAALASGIASVGLHNGSPLALSSRFAPPIALAQNQRLPLPMARTPAIDGAEFVSVGGNGYRAHWAKATMRLLRPSTSLDLRLDGTHRMAGPWLDAAPTSAGTADLVVVGGGVAGMAAALAAAKLGNRVTLLEAGPVLGGNARFFGSQEGEESPDASIARLSAAVAAKDAITVLLDAEVFAVRPGRVRVHVVRHDGELTADVVEITAPRIILATGAYERLPVFPGNRLPGVIGALEAFHRADRHGVWAGRSAMLAIASSPAYRLAMLASDAGIIVQKICDARPDPQSRFIEFSKAYGIPLAAGLAPVMAETTRSGLSVTLQLAIGDYSRLEPAQAVETLVVCGGWQPDLSLWHLAGGQSRWNAERRRLEAVEGPEGIRLAGSAAGYLSKQACLQSGQDAVAALYNRARKPVSELLIDPIYETPDGATPMAPPRIDGPPGYLDGGLSCIAMPVDTRPGWRRLLPFASPLPTWSLAEQKHALAIGDVAAGVQLQAIPAESAGIVAQERSAIHGALETVPPRAPEPDLPLVPNYLIGRFGPHPVLWTITAAEPRALEVGGLLFVNSDQSKPHQAIGAVVRADANSAIALIGKPTIVPGEGATLREQGRPVAVRLVAPYSR